jgi:hypothetical protein
LDRATIAPALKYPRCSPEGSGREKIPVSGAMLVNLGGSNGFGLGAASDQSVNGRAGARLSSRPGASSRGPQPDVSVRQKPTAQPFRIKRPTIRSRV